MTALLTLISGIVSGLIASLIFFVITKSVKAQIVVSDDIKVVKNATGQYLYVVKIVNLSRADLINLQYSLCHCETTCQNGPSILMTEMNTAKGKLFLISGYKKQSEYNEFAVQITFKVDNTNFPIDNNHHLIFSITAEHSTFGTSRNVKKKYYLSNVKEGEFEQGCSVKIV